MEIAVSTQSTACAVAMKLLTRPTGHAVVIEDTTQGTTCAVTGKWSAVSGTGRVVVARCTIRARRVVATENCVKGERQKKNDKTMTITCSRTICH